MKTKFFEEVEKKWIFFKSKTFVFEVTVSEISTFTTIFSTATTRLKEWYEECPGQAVAFEMRVSTSPHIYERAVLAMERLREGEGAYAFVKKLKFSIVFQNTDTGEVSRFQLP